MKVRFLGKFRSDVGLWSFMYCTICSPAVLGPPASIAVLARNGRDAAAEGFGSACVIAEPVEGVAAGADLRIGVIDVDDPLEPAGVVAGPARRLGLGSRGGVIGLAEHCGRRVSFGAVVEEFGHDRSSIYLGGRMYALLLDDDMIVRRHSRPYIAK